MKRFLLALSFLVIAVSSAFAQNNQRNPCYYLAPNNINCQAVSPTTPLPVTPVSGSTPQTVNLNQISGVASNAISTSNSTATPLGSNGVFTGTSEDISAYSSVSVTIFSDQASSTNGLSLQQSSDGTNWDNMDAYTVPASTGKTFGAQIAAKFFRVIYTNGAVAQGSLRLQTIYHGFMPVTQSQRPSDAITNDNDFGETMAFNMVWNPVSSLWQRMPGNTAGVSINPYPATSTPITSSATGTTAATVATFAANATKTNYICGFTITSTATVALAGVATVTGTISGALNYVQGVGLAPAVGNLTQSFSPCIPGSAINTALSVTSAAGGAGGVVAVTAWGYQL